MWFVYFSIAGNGLLLFVVINFCVVINGWELENTLIVVCFLCVRVVENVVEGWKVVLGDNVVLE